MRQTQAHTRGRRQPFIYAREALMFDIWARWYARRWDQAMGARPKNLLVKLAAYGIRIGLMQSAEEPLDDAYWDAEKVNQFMIWVRPVCRPIHAALNARHRGVVVPAGAAEPLVLPRATERDYACAILQDPTPAGIQRYRRLCVQGYRLYRDGAGQKKAR